MTKVVWALVFLAACSLGKGNPRVESRNANSATAPSVVSVGQHAGVMRSDARVILPAAATDQANLLQAVLDDANLDRYVHFDVRPERRPLSILQNETVIGHPALKKFGVPVEYIPENSPKINMALVFTSVSIQGDTAEVHLKYPPEGIVGKAILIRQDTRWKSRGVKIVEQ